LNKEITNTQEEMDGRQSLKNNTNLKKQKANNHTLTKINKTIPKNPKGNLLLIIKTSRYIAPIGLLLSAFSLLVSVLLGFGGFNIEAFSGYSIIGYVSMPQMGFLILSGLGLILSGIGYANYAKNQKEKNPNLILLLCLGVSMVFFTTAIFGLTSQLRGLDFWGESTLEEIQNTLFFNNLTLTCFLALGILQIILSIIFIKTKILKQQKLSKIAKILTLTSGILLIIKTMADYPLIKESIFILSYMLKIPFPNNILSIATAILYLFAQIPIVIILLRNQKP
jgi:magnesium-transporting ATPase (P-type)